MTAYAFALYAVSAISVIAAVGVGIASWRFYRDN
ncbi:hypothetical protein FIU83_04070 [Halomonas sp. THAF5a]|nr:hypothetical protein FIU83_04070 [Halomonas sp. THAF5a]